MNESVYITLLDEGSPVRRPGPAHKIGPDSYIVLRPDDYDPNDEHWEFPPGSIVTCESRPTSQGTILVAVRRTSSNRQSA